MRATGKTAATAAVIVALFATFAVARGSARVSLMRASDPTDPAPACPADCRTIEPGDSIQNAINSSAPGASLCLRAGDYRGPVKIDRAVSLYGSRAAVIHSNGIGRTVSIIAGGASVSGFTVDGSGHRYDLMDSAVYVHGDGAVVRAITIRNALYGIDVERSKSVTVDANHIVGDIRTEIGIRGDAIRIFSSPGSSVTRNLVENARDVLVWFSPGVRVAENVIHGCRYATHFMYSNNGVAEHNRSYRNTVGVFVMYSDNIRISDNVLAGNNRFDGFGMGAKESGNLTIENNRFVQDRIGLYFDQCPFRPNQTDHVRGNLFALCEAAINFLGSAENNVFENNTLRDNQTQVRVNESGNLLDASWSGNYFDDYQGYDLGGDGFGDVPYELRSLAGEVVSRHPEIAFFQGTVALRLIEAVGAMIPLFQPRPILIDRKPRMYPAPGNATG